MEHQIHHRDVDRALAALRQLLVALAQPPAARQPGPLREAAGVEVEEFYALLAPVPVEGEGFKDAASQIWAERLQVLDAGKTQVLVRYGPSNGWLDARAAVTMHPYGKGRVYYVGAYLDDASQKTLMDRIAADAGVKGVLDTPEGVEARKRTAPDGKDVFIVINHTREEKAVALPWPAQEHLTGRPVRGSLTLDADDVAVLTQV